MTAENAGTKAVDDAPEPKVAHPLIWVPTSYFAMGTVYVTVTTASTIMFVNLGMSTAEAAFYSSWLGFAYTIKFLWAPLLEMYRTKKFFVITMQFGLAALLAGVALLLPLPGRSWVLPVAGLLLLGGFLGATMDIATDGVYVTTLSPKRQAQFTGVQSMSWSIGPVVATGLVIWLVGKLHNSMSYRWAWMLVLLGMAIMLAVVALNHLSFLPPGAKAKDAPTSVGEAFVSFGRAWVSFVKKPAILWMMLFAFFYRFGLGLLDKIGPPFLIDSRIAGGIGLDNQSLGLVNGTVGTIAFIIASVVGGLYVARGGLRRVLFVLVFALNVPNLTFLYLGLAQPDNTTTAGLVTITICVFLEKFGWGFGAVGHMLYMMQQIAPGPYKTAHYAFATALLGFCMMATGLLSSWILPNTGYEAFFIVVLVGAAPSILATLLAPFIHPEDETVAAKEPDSAGALEKRYVLSGATRMIAIGATVVLALVVAGVAYAKSSAFQAERAALRADPAACLERSEQRACYFQCDAKGPDADAACARLSSTFAESAKQESDQAKYDYLRREAWKWYEKSLDVRCDRQDAPDYTACAQKGSIMLEPELWGDAVSRDAELAAQYLGKACEKGNDQAACERRTCAQGDAAKCQSLCEASYAPACRELAARLEADRKKDEANQWLEKGLTLRCERGGNPDPVACVEKAKRFEAANDAAKAKEHYAHACALGVKPACAK